MSKQITVFTDGSSRGNPGPGGWGAIVASDLNVYELAGQENPTTNNRMELSAVIASLEFLRDHNQTGESVTIYSDSQYFKNGFESWMYGWQKKGWVTAKKEPVLNQDLWQKLLDLKPVFTNLDIVHVKGHVGIPGNERADELATLSADDLAPNLYRGRRDKYPINLSNKKDITVSTKKSRKRTGKAYCYLSMVDGQIIEHDDWVGCKKRVSGQKGAKFRRADSQAERDEIVSTWKQG